MYIWENNIRYFSPPSTFENMSPKQKIHCVYLNGFVIFAKLLVLILLDDNFYAENTKIIKDY